MSYDKRAALLRIYEDWRDREHSVLPLPYAEHMWASVFGTLSNVDYHLFFRGYAYDSALNAVHAELLVQRTNQPNNESE